MSKFKVGDRVTVSYCTGVNEKYNGCRGTVISYSSIFSPGVHVRMDGFTVDLVWFDEELELLEEKKPMVYKTLGEMTREEKGELLLAQHEHKQIQHSHNGINWVDSVPQWIDGVYYRKKPEPVSVILFGHTYGGDDFVFGHDLEFHHTHKITFNVVDGVVDCSSVKMEAL